MKSIPRYNIVKLKTKQQVSKVTKEKKKKNKLATKGTTVRLRGGSYQQQRDVIHLFKKYF